MSDTVKKLKEMLYNNISESSKVFIVGHNEPDYDCIGSSFGISTIAKSLGKEAYIIVNDKDIAIDPGVKKIYEENKERYNIITLEEFRNLVDDNSLLITTDVNRSYLVSVEHDLDKFKNILIIDHHEEDDKYTIKTTNKWIDQMSSSSSELIAQVLNLSKVKYDKETATYLLAGIILDTQRYIKNTTHKTLDTAEKLMRKGADLNDVNALFLREFAQDGEAELLIHMPGNTVVQVYETASQLGTRNVSFTINREKPTKVYRKVNIAQAADKMLKYEVADAAFVLAYITPDDIAISARSRSDIDVGQIMGHLEKCGGNKQNAGGKITSDDIFAVEQEIMKQVKWGLPLEEETEKIKVKKFRKD